MRKMVIFGVITVESGPLIQIESKEFQEKKKHTTKVYYLPFLGAAIISKSYLHFIRFNAENKNVISRQ